MPTFALGLLVHNVGQTVQLSTTASKLGQVGVGKYLRVCADYQPFYRSWAKS